MPSREKKFPRTVRNLPAAAASNGSRAVRFNLEVAIRADFAGIFGVRAERIVRRGRIATDWVSESSTLAMTYHNKDFSRSLFVKPYNNESPAVYANGRLSFEIALDPGASWHSCLSYEIADGERRFASPINCIEHTERSKFWKDLKDWQRNVLKIRTSNEEIYRLFRQAVETCKLCAFPLPAAIKRTWSRPQVCPGSWRSLAGIA